MSNVSRDRSPRHLRWLIPLLFLCGFQSFAAPINDHFASATQLSFDTNHVTGSNIGATRERGEPWHDESTGNASVWWKFFAPDDGFVTLSTAGSVIPDEGELDTILVVYFGSSISQLGFVTVNDDEEDSQLLTSKATFQVFKNIPYYVAVDGWSEYDTGIIELTYEFSKEHPITPAPKWSVTDIQGNPLNSTQFEGKVTLVNFWATWCPSCVERIPDLVALHEDYEKFGFSVVGISVDESDEGNPPSSLVGQFVEDHAIPYPIGLDAPSFKVSNAFGGLQSVPTFFLIDREGNIVHRRAGVITKDELDGWIKPLLKESIPIKIENRGGELWLTWKTTHFAIVIPQYTNSLETRAWLNMEGSVEVHGEESSIRISSTENARFFRLKIE